MVRAAKLVDGNYIDQENKKYDPTKVTFYLDDFNILDCLDLKKIFVETLMEV